MFQRLLVCSDLTDGLQRLVHFVPNLAAGGATQIVFLHVVPFGDEVSVPRPDLEQINDAKAKLSAALRQAPVGTDIQIEVQSGRTIDVILRTAQAYQSDVILLGTPIRNTIAEKLFGSTSLELADRSSIPLLTLRPQLISTYTSDELALRCRNLLRQVLVPINGSDASTAVIDRLEELAKHQSPPTLRTVLLCWVVEEGGRLELSVQEQQATVRQTLEPIRDRLQAIGLTTPIEVRHGHPVTEVLLAAQESDISAIVLSTTHGKRFLDWSTPSFADEILRRSWHPVLFFPPQK